MTLPYPTDQYYSWGGPRPGAFVVQGARIVRFGKLKGKSLDRMMARTARRGGISFDLLHACWIRIAPHRGDREAMMAALGFPA